MPLPSSPSKKDVPPSPQATADDDSPGMKEALRRIEKARRDGSRVLNLSNLKLTTLPEALGNLTALTWLNLSGNQLTTLPEALGKLKALTTLYLHSNQLTTLPEALGKLTALKELNLSSNQLTTLPEALGKLTALKELNLTDNRLTTLPEALGNLTALTELRLDNNQLTTLPESLGKLTTLTRLDLDNNQLTTLPEALGKLKALTTLYLHSNQLTTLPEALGKLTALKELNLSSNQLTTLPEALGKLTALTRLSFSRNQLTTLPEELGNLTALTTLRLNNNQLTTLPEALGNLTALTWLYLHDNPGLGLPAEVLGPTLDEVRLNKGRTPAQPKKILAYYFRLHGAKQKTRGRALQEARIILIGDGAAGKTSLARQLLQEEAAREDEASTRDVVVAPWLLKLKKGEVKVHVWDFGGQRQMHAAHPYFFTTRTLYLVVADARKDQQDRVDYWLKMVEKFGHDARALVVMNKVELEGYAMALDRPKLLGRFPKNLPEDATRAFFPVSCKSGDGIGALREAIRREIQDMDQVWAQWPGEWFAVKQTIQQMREPKRKCPRWLSRLLSFLPSVHQAHPAGVETFDYKEWRRICDACQVPDEQDRDELLAMLGHLGLVVAFPTDARLRPLGVLNPEWVTRGIYPLLVDKRLGEKGGLLLDADLETLLPQDRFPKEQHRWLLDLMMAFELAFSDARGNRMVPAQLPTDSPPWAQPRAWDSTDILHLELRYDGVLPDSVISQFIVRRHADARNPGEWWRHGIAIKLGRAEALVRAHTTEQEAKIELRLRGPREDRLPLLHSIRETLRDPRDARPPVLHVILGPDCAPIYQELLTHAASGVTRMPFVIKGKSEMRELAPILDMIETRAEQAAAQQALTVQINNHNQPTVNQNTGTNLGNIGSGNTQQITNSQVGVTLENCRNTIGQQAPGQKKELLGEIQQAAEALVAKLPPDKQEEAADSLERFVKEATAEKPNRKWYSVSAEGLLEASVWLKEFSGNIADTLTGPILKLGRLLWPDFSLPGAQDGE